MATVNTKPGRQIEYPTSDGKPMAETDLHRDLMVECIAILKDWFASNRDVYVSGNLLIFYAPGDKRKHVAPDVFVVRGVPKRNRDNYLVWEEGKGPDVVIELTSKTTKKEDTDKKLKLYRDVLKVQEYFLCDPTNDYLKPPLQGFRLVEGDYKPIEPVEGRLPSENLGLHLERSGQILRFWNCDARAWLPTPSERARQNEGQLAQAEQEIARLNALVEAQQRDRHPGG